VFDFYITHFISEIRNTTGMTHLKIVKINVNLFFSLIKCNDINAYS